MNSSSTYLSSHQAAENPSATCRLTGDDSIAHKESALYRKVRNLSSIHDGMPNLCRIPDGCGLVYIKMLRLSSFFCQKFEPSQKTSENINFFYSHFIRPLCRPSGREHLHQSAGPLPSPIREDKAAWQENPSPAIFQPRAGKKNLGEGATASCESSSPSPNDHGPYNSGPNAPRPSRDRCPSPPAAARKAPCLRGRRPA